MGLYLAYMIFGVSFTLFGMFIGWHMHSSVKSESHYDMQIILEELKLLKNNLRRNSK